MRHLIWPVTYYLLGATAGVLAGLYCPAQAAQRTLPPHDCGSALGILEQSLPRTQTSHLRTQTLLAHR